MAVTFDNAASSAGLNTNDPSFSFTVGAGSNLVLYVWFRVASFSGFGTTSYNGVAMTLIVDHADIKVWRLVNPTSGSNTVQFTCTASGNTHAGAISFDGAAQSGTIETAGTVATGTSTSPSSTVSTASTDLVIGLMEHDTSTTTGTAGTNETERLDAGTRVKAYEEPGNGGTVTIAPTLSGSVRWSQVAISIKVAAAAGTAVKDIIGGGVVPWAR